MDKFYINIKVSDDVRDPITDRILRRLVVSLCHELGMMPQKVFVFPFDPYIKYTRKDIAKLFRIIADKIAKSK